MQREMQLSMARLRSDNDKIPEKVFGDLLYCKVCSAVQPVVHVLDKRTLSYLKRYSEVAYHTQHIVMISFQ